jgi:hypothetical protein
LCIFSFGIRKHPLYTSPLKLSEEKLKMIISVGCESKIERTILRLAKSPSFHHHMMDFKYIYTPISFLRMKAKPAGFHLACIIFIL